MLRNLLTIIYSWIRGKYTCLISNIHHIQLKINLVTRLTINIPKVNKVYYLIALDLEFNILYRNFKMWTGEKF